MPPGMPHFVITPQPAVCVGRYGYCWSTIQQSVIAIYNSFIYGATTNSYVSQGFKMLRRMVIDLKQKIYAYYIQNNHEIKEICNNFFSISYIYY